MRLFFIGDIVGKTGRKAVRKNLNRIRKEHNIDLVVANAENLAGGKGATEKTLKEMEKAGVDFLLVEIIYSLKKKYLQVEEKI